MARFLVKTEPSTYSFADLERDKRTVWDGVSNPVALKHLATIRKGDTVVVYHTGDEKQAVGLAVAASDAYPDPKLKDPKRPVVDLAADRPLPRAGDAGPGEGRRRAQGHRARAPASTVGHAVQRGSVPAPVEARGGITTTRSPDSQHKEQRDVQKYSDAVQLLTCGDGR